MAVYTNILRSRDSFGILSGSNGESPYCENRLVPKRFSFFADETTIQRSADDSYGVRARGPGARPERRLAQRSCALRRRAGIAAPRAPLQPVRVPVCQRICRIRAVESSPHKHLPRSQGRWGCNRVRSGIGRHAPTAVQRAGGSIAGRSSFRLRAPVRRFASVADGCAQTNACEDHVGRALRSARVAECIGRFA
jgi:hypothetical protein